MAAPYAFVTLVTSDSYLPGALALVAALKDLHPSPPTPPEVDFQTVCLVTPETVDVASIKLLRRAFNIVIGVEIIEQEDEKNLRLLGRPDLSTVLTKLHVFRLTQYSKIIFLDADVLPVRPLSHLLTLPHEFSAVPDVGWPDIFNSGVLVLTPGEDKFNDLMKLQKSKGSWDGGDQGLLNEWRGSDWNRLSFVYNTTPTAAYTYAPAYERFGSGITALHFIGPDKPWKGLLYRSPGIKTSGVPAQDGTKRAYNYDALVDRWYDVYDRHYRQDPTLPTASATFSLPRYSSVWDDGVSLGAELPASSNMPASGSGGALGLDELRKLAVEGLNAVARSLPPSILPASSIEGEYRSMPLEGRVDLMRPMKQPESTSQPNSQGQDPSGDGGQVPATPRPIPAQISLSEPSYFPGGISTTPGPNEVPNAPYIHGHSLPPSETPTPYYGPPSGSGSQYNNSLQVFYQPQVHSEPGPESQVGSQDSQWQQNQQQQFQQPYVEHQFTQQSYQSQPRTLHQQHSSQSHISPSQYHQEQEQPQANYRHVSFTPQPRDDRYTQDSSDSDSPTTSVLRLPPYVARQQHQDSQQYLQQFQQPAHTHALRVLTRQDPQQQQQAQTHHRHQRTSGDQRTQTRPKEQQRTSRRTSMDQGQGQAPYAHMQQQQRSRGDRTPLSGQQSPRVHTQHGGRPSPQLRRSSPLASGQNTPTQEHPGGHTQRGQDSQRPRLRHHGEYHTPHNQPREPRPHEYIQLHQKHVEHGHYAQPEPQHQPPSSPSQQQRISPSPRPISPPKVSWNPAVEPPPKESPVITAFPEDTYFPNVWDQPPSQEHDATHQSFPSPERGSRADVFFHPPPPPVIPEQLVREGQYSNVLGQATDNAAEASPPAPDKSKVQAVFPWEEKPRHVPRRVFPRTDSPPPAAAHYIESERTSSPISTPPPPLPATVGPVHTPSSPVQGIQWGSGFSNAWDSVPSIQRYASKLVGSPKIYPHLFMAQPAPPPPQDDDWRKQWREQREREWQDTHDASSMDGDDEDEGESEDDEEEGGHNEGGRGGGPKGRTRSASMGGKSKKQYKTRGVQASPETDTKEVQVGIITDKRPVTCEIGVGTDLPGTLETILEVPQQPVGLGLRKQWQQGSPYSPGTALLPSAVLRDFKTEPEQGVGTPLVNITARSAMPFPSLASPTGLRSPPTLASPRTYSPPSVISPRRIDTPPKLPSPPRVSSPLASPSVIKAPSPIKAASPPALASPRSGISPRPALARSTGSPRQSTTPRRVSTSSLPAHSSSRAHSPVIGTTARVHHQSTPSPKHIRLSSLTSPLAPGLIRTSSADTYVTPSPSTTNDSIATPGDTPVAERTRRGSRVWDPARGVDVFKRGSEEVLSRFLRMGSFDDEEGKNRQNVQSQS